MHELPKELTKSLRSWRGSIYRDEPIDLEKQDEYMYGSKVSDEALNSTENSPIPHPKYTNQALDQARQAQFQQVEHPQELQYERSQPSGSQQQQGQGEGQSDGPSYGQGYGQSQGQSQAQQQGQQHQNIPQSSSQAAVTVRQPTFPPQTPASAKKSVLTAPKVKDVDPAADRLDDDATPLSAADFYELVGMKPPISKTQNPNELRTPNGLYGEILHRLNYTQNQYRAFDILTYAFLILQLIISAVFIVLGSITQLNSHVAIPVLGAVSTVVAGSLALMKGQGLPNRLRQTRDALRTVKFEAEELYWDVGADRDVYYKDVKKLREDFLRVMEEARSNHPDTWNKTAEGVAQGVTPASKAKQASVAPGATPKP